MIGLVLIIPNSWFILWGYIWGQSRPTTVSLYFNVIITLLLVCALNGLVRRVLPRWALRQGELLVIYSMLAISSAVCGLDQLQTMLPVIAHPFWHATPENHWQQLFLEKIPPWLTVSDERALWAYYDSGQSLFATPYWKPWMVPAAWWASFSFTMIFVMLCLSSLFRKQWTEEAKLSFPIVQLPLEMAKPDTKLWSSRLMWIGFGVAFAIDAINGLHQLYPWVPSLMGERSAKFDLGQMVKAMPWKAIGWTPLNVFPFGVGLAFFIPTDLSLSSWFFYIFWKIVRVFTTAAGWGSLPRAPWVDEQSFGAYIALAAFSLYSSRHHLLHAWESAFGTRKFDDPQEAFTYRFAIFGLIGGLTLLMGFCLYARMSFIVAAAFLLLYLGLSIAVSRIRAELGSPVHDLHKIGPEAVLTEIVGPRRLGVSNDIMFAFFWSFNRAHRSHPMPNQIEGMKLASVSHVSQRGLAVALTLATAVGLAAGWFILLDAFFRQGGEGWAYKGQEAWGRLQSSLESPIETNWYAGGAIVLGMAFTMFLAWMRTNFTWWPLHPAGFAVSGGFSMALFAPSIFISWLLKVLILRYGGMSSFRPASMFFMGLILGEFAAGAIWGVLGNLLHMHMYNFLP
ncbi:MAG: DUF6785 family protein [Armatimonadota bacterium]